MKDKELEKKKISELRTMAKELGIVQKREWKKEDFIKAIRKAEAAKKSVSRKKERKAAVSAKATVTTARKTAIKKKAPVKSKAEKKPLPAEDTGVSSGAARREKMIDKISRMPHELPNGAGDFIKMSSRVTLMVIDPYKLFVYWDIDVEEVERIVSDGEGFITLLRIFFFKDGEQTGFFDIRISELSGKKYIEVVPDRGYQVEFAVLKGEKYFPVIRSKVKSTPSFKIVREDLSEEKIEILMTQIPEPKVRISS